MHTLIGSREHQLSQVPKRALGDHVGIKPVPDSAFAVCTHMLKIYLAVLMRWQLCWKCPQREPSCRRFRYQNIWAEMTKSKLNTNGWGLVTRGGVENWLAAFAVSNKLLVKWHLWIWNPSWFRTKKRVENEAAEKKKKALMPPSSSPDCIDNNIRKNTASFCWHQSKNEGCSFVSSFFCSHFTCEDGIPMRSHLRSYLMSQMGSQ